MSKVVTADYFEERLEKSFTDFSHKLLAYLGQRFDEVDKRLDTLDEKYDKLMTTLDAFLKRLDDIEKENQIRDHELERMKRWIEQIAQKTGVKLEY